MGKEKTKNSATTHPPAKPPSIHDIRGCTADVGVWGSSNVNQTSPVVVFPLF